MILWFLFSCDVASKSYQTVSTIDDSGTPEIGYPFGYPYLLSFHVCNVVESNCGDPSGHKVHLAGSENGADWELISDMEPFPSSVPDVHLRDNILYVMGLPELQRYNVETGVWMETAYPQVFSGTEPVMHVDPSMFVDEQNRLVLFFMEGFEGSDPATCPPGESTCTKYFLSATEVPGSLGTAFSLDPGNRMEIVLNEQQRIAADPDIFIGPDGYYQYVSRGQNTQVFFSDQLRGTYVPIDTVNDGLLVMGGGGVPAGYYHTEDEHFWTFVTTNADEGKTDIRLARHGSLYTPLRFDDFDTVLSGADAISNDYLVSSPGFFAIEQPE